MVLGEQGFCSKCGNAYLSNNHSINCLSSQTPFTDDDLKRLKDSGPSPLSSRELKAKDFWALLSRLEAAEKICDDLLKHGLTFRWHDAMEAWRKAAGK